MNQVFEYKSLPSEFLCSFCNTLIKEPVTCAECLAANFCLKCAEEIRQKKPASSCPVCKAAWCDKSLKSNPFFIKIYDMTSIRCSNNECKWEGLIKDYFDHQEECLERTIDCPFKKFGCNWQGTSNFHMEHHKSSCPFLSFQFFFEKIEKNLNELAENNKKNLELIENQNKTIESLNQRIEDQNKVIATLKLVIQGKNAALPQPLPLKSAKPPSLQGILRNLSLSSLIEKGFKVGFIEPYNYQNSFDEFINKFSNKRYVLLGGKEKDEDQIILAAMGETKEVFKETKNERECHYHNGVYWYCMKTKAIGFSFNPRIFLYNADWIEGEEHRNFEDERLSWHLTGNGGWRVGKIVSLSESNAYEKVLLYWD